MDLPMPGEGQLAFCQLSAKFMLIHPHPLPTLSPVQAEQDHHANRRDHEPDPDEDLEVGQQVMGQAQQADEDGEQEVGGGMGAALGVGGHLSALRRTAVGAFAIDTARTLDDLADAFAIMPIAQAARLSFPVVELDETQAQDVRFGRRLAIDLDSLSAVFAPDGEFLALYEPTTYGGAKAAAVFV